MHEVRSIWTPDDVDIRELTDTDLEATRMHSSRLYDTSGELQALIAVYAEQSDLETDSAIVDRALRIELAAWLDSLGSTRQRSDYDLAYTIPPDGWVTGYCPVVTIEELPVDASVPPGVNYTTPEIVSEIADDAINAGTYDGETAIVRAGLKRMITL